MSRFVRSYRARKIFLDCLEMGKSASFAANAAGGTTRNFRAWRRDDEDFAKDWEDAEEAGTDFLEDVAVDRATLKSDQLLQFLLKARRPDKFDRGNKLEISGGISVEGQKSKLLNRLQRLKGNVQSEGEEAEQEILEEDEEQTPLLPPPGPRHTEAKDKADQK